MSLCHARVKCMTDNNEKSLDEVLELISKQHVAMLTTIDDGKMVSRPMGASKPDEDGAIWLFTTTGSDKAVQITADNRVNLTYADGDYLSIQGTAEMVQDPKLQRELWNKPVEAWLQCEPEDPQVSLIKVTPDTIGYWDTPTAVGSTLSMIKGLVTNEQPDGGEAGVVNVNN